MNTIEDRARSVFLDALEVPSDQWPSLLDQACGDDAGLRSRVDQLLRAHQEMGSIHDGEAATAALDGDAVAERPGDVIGPYKLVQQIGEGGFGVVFLAEQDGPIRRRVALKIIKPGMDTREVIARFEAERQALAMMDHPNIARALEAGTTETGRPYFVMELVQGVPMTEYCDECNLLTRERLKLFITVCQAVQHAHQKGVIHRDVKPTNVLVAIQDGQPVAKIIDFGVAKAIHKRLTERTMVTAFAQILGTPLYMSPEQAELSPLGVDTRTDIYSLGVLLYELLTGTTPFDKDRFREASYDELRRIIREEEPPRPSARISTLAADQATTVAEHRRTDPRRLTQSVRGDLDWIVLKCLEKDRNRRYETANGLARDVERYLNDQPVEACPPSARYRLSKFAQRNKAVIATAMALVTVLVLGMVGTSWQAIRATQERNRALLAEATAEREATRATQEAARADAAAERAEQNLRQAREVVDRLLTRVAEGLTGAPHMEQLRRELLEDALEFYQRFQLQNSDDPAIREETAASYRRVGRIHHDLGNVDKEIEAYRESIRLYEELYKDFKDNESYRRNLAAIPQRLGLTLHEHGRYAEAQPYYQQTLEHRRALARDYPTNYRYRQQVVWFGHCNLLICQQRRVREVEQLLLQALEELDRMEADFPEAAQDYQGRRASAYNLLAHVCLMTGNREREAEEYLLKQLAILEGSDAVLPIGAPVYTLLTPLALVQNDPAKAESLSRRRLKFWRTVSNNNPDYVWNEREVVQSLEHLTYALWQMRRFEEALEVAQQRDDTASKLLQGHPLTVDGKYNLATALFAVAKHRQAEDLYRQALGQFEQRASDYPEIAGYHERFAYVLLTCPVNSLRDPEKSRTFAARAVQLSPENAILWSLLGGAQAAAGDYSEALESFSKAKRFSGGELRADARLRLALSYWRSGDRERGRQLYDEVVQELPDNPYIYPYPNSIEMGLLRAEVAEAMGIPAEQKTDHLQKIPVPLESPNTGEAFAAPRAGAGVGPPDRIELLVEALGEEARRFPNNPGPWLVRARLYAEQQAWDEAAADWVRAIEIASDSGSWDSARKRICREMAALPEVFGRVAPLLPDEPALWIGRGQHRSLCSRWSDAASDYAHGFRLRSLTGESVFEYAGNLLLSGDKQGYEQVCAELLEQAEEADAPIDPRTCGIGPAESVEPERLLESATRHSEEDAMPWTLHMLGLAQYRAGEFDAAIESLKASNAGAWDELPKVQNWLLLAMANQQLQNVDEARWWLGQAQKAIEAARPDSPADPVDVQVPDWIGLELLRREAESVILPNGTDEGAESKSEDDDLKRRLKRA